MLRTMCKSSQLFKQPLCILISTATDRCEVMAETGLLWLAWLQTRVTRLSWWGWWQRWGWGRKQPPPPPKPSESTLPGGLTVNISLPATGDEAMKRLLACKGKDPYR